MKPRRTSGPWGRRNAAALAAGLVIIGTVVLGSVTGQPDPGAPVQVAAAERPSFLSELPERTAEALRAGSIAPTDIDAAAADALLQSTAATSVAATSPRPEATTEMPEATTVVPEAAHERFQVTAAGLNVRAEPSSKSGKLFVLKQGEAVQVAEADGNWARVVTDAGDAGWAYIAYLSPVEGVAEPAAPGFVATGGTNQRS